MLGMLNQMGDAPLSEAKAADGDAGQQPEGPLATGRDARIFAQPGDVVGPDGGFYPDNIGQPGMEGLPQVSDVWIEGGSGNEPHLHQSVNVGDPFGENHAYSFGTEDKAHPWRGRVYEDEQRGGAIEAYKTTTPEQDAQFKAKMDNDVGKSELYGIDDICRSWSQREFQNAPGQLTTPPNRTPVPFNTPPSEYDDLFRELSTTGTWILR